MDVVGSEIGQKMRSAIKAKLTELGCYVDDELPDYVMVMVANKRTRGQMEDDLQLFLGDNTELFVNWLHQVLKKLQEVTVTAPIKTAEQEKSKERSASKDRKSKDKKDKDKSKKSDLKKAKKKEKEKLHRKKEEKKEKKSKKKSKHHDMIRPNIPPLLMNMEKESEPSITDVFAGQILKSHGISMESLKEDKVLEKVEQKVIIKEHKRPIVPIIDPATISSQPDPDVVSLNSENTMDSQEKITKPSVLQETAKEDQIKEINEIEAKIQGLKQKLAEQLDSMSEDEDFLNIRTEAEELMNDFAEDVFQEISQQAPVSTPPLEKCKSPSPPKEIPPKPVEVPKPIETLPQIELNLPKRPVRERLGAREEHRRTAEVERRTEQKSDSQERFTPEPLPEFMTKTKSAKSRLSDPPERSGDFSDDSDKPEPSIKRLTSKVSVLESRVRCASVVRVRPRPRVSAPASSLLMRAVADAHKSLLTTPPKVDSEPPMIKRGIVLPMRRVGDPNIVIQVPGERTADSQDDNISLEIDSDEEKRVFSELDRDEYVPKSLTMQIKNTDYVPSKRNEVRTASRRDDTLVIETINIHNPTVDKDKNTQFIVTMDGFNPNAFLAKKLMTEGLLNDDEETEKAKDTSNNEKDSPKEADKEEPQELEIREKSPEPSPPKSKEVKSIEKDTPEISNEEPKESPIKRLSSESTESNTQVVIKQDKLKESKSKEENSKILRAAEKRKSDTVTQPPKVEEKSPPVKKRRTPIVFDVDKKQTEVVKERVRTESASSDNNVILTTASSSHKYDALPPLSTSERKPVWCRAFPLCRYGSACAFQHPRCKFAAACTRRGCVYAHATPPVPTPTPTISSHVVPVANYKSISTAPTPGMCKYYPSCSNPTCGFFHPKACRYGAACLNKLECNFYHADLPPSHWRHPA
ncbi:zinc finger CCCH domain-containing protein 14 [Ostrinia nubilalis]|uniref:zinc finger CCCH domain-containing protein 14 n=1 Tax=Ostrinia nubilalis TaxID=29057 RepID=UPI0030824B66